MITHRVVRPVFAALMLVVATGWIAVRTSEPVSFTPDSRIWVTGTSTVHDWTCEVGAFDGAVELSAGTAGAVAEAWVQVPVRALDCKNGTMDKKATAALRADKHPAIRFTFDGVRSGAVQADGGQKMTVDGTLEIAGRKRGVALDAVRYPQGDAYRFTGSVPLRMTDFGVEPPTAMLGTLKTGDAVVVHFDVATRGR